MGLGESEAAGKLMRILQYILENRVTLLYVSESAQNLHGLAYRAVSDSEAQEVNTRNSPLQFLNNART
jgi:hypothetical protein